MVFFENRLNNLDETHTIWKQQDLVTDLILSLCGEELGSGSFRKVYQYNPHPDYVIKLEYNNHNCNFTEAMLWNEIQHLKGTKAWVKDWFAPVDWISPNGRVLVMRKTEQRPKKKKPEKVPSFLWDVKDDNFGWIGNKFVCHDYGQFYNFIEYKKTFKKAKWEQ